MASSCGGAGRGQHWPTPAAGAPQSRQQIILSGSSSGSGSGPALLPPVGIERHKGADVVCANGLRHEHDARPVDKVLELSLLVRSPQAKLQSISDMNVAYFRQPLGAPWS
ncbi:hypothetical protein VCV18_003392 [Metarhizium anisopliae]